MERYFLAAKHLGALGTGIINCGPFVPRVTAGLQEGTAGMGHRASADPSPSLSQSAFQLWKVMARTGEEWEFLSQMGIKTPPEIPNPHTEPEQWWGTRNEERTEQEA